MEPLEKTGGKLPGPHIPATVWEAVIVEIPDDSFLGVRMAHKDDSPTIYVARPYLLGKLEGWNGITYSYTDSEAQQRTASKAGETDEDQEITPPYVVDDRIYIIGRVHNSNQVYTDSDGSEHYCAYVDLNVDGRQWAVVSA